MIKTLPEIQAAIVGGEITAITLDTSIFEALQKELEHGLLRRLSQFKDSDTKVLLSDVVLREVDAHLRSDAEKALTAVRRAKSLISRSWLHESAGAFESGAQTVLLADAATMVKSRLNAFCEASGVVEIKADQYVKAGDVIGRYFSNQPPFGIKETKKHEFPDAFALLALEAWAVETDSYVLVVTRDGDWIAYCAESERLIALNNLSDALGCFQKETARYACQTMLELYEGSDPLEMKVKMLEALNNQCFEKIELNTEVYSQYEYDEDVVVMNFSDFDIQTGRVEPVEFGDDYVVASINIRASVEIQCFYGFQKWDSIDREYISMGAGSAVYSDDLSLQMLVTLQGELPKKMDIVEIELLPKNLHLDLGEIEPSWMSDFDNEDEDLFAE